VAGKVQIIGHRRLIRALRKAGFHVVREGKHTIMRKNEVFLAIPRHNPLKRYTIEGIIKDSGLTFEEFNRLIS